jgi:AraC-like DNA-binding protein
MALMPLPEMKPAQGDALIEGLQAFLGAGGITRCWVLDAQSSPPDACPHLTHVPYLVVIEQGHHQIHHFGEAILLHAREAVLYLPGTGVDRSETHAGSWLRFTWDEDHCLAAHNDFHPKRQSLCGLPLPGLPGPLVEDIVHRLQSDLRKQPDLRAALYANALLTEAWDRLRSQGEPSKLRGGRDADLLRYLRDHLQYPMDRARVARAIGVHPGHLSRLVRQFWSCSFLQLLTNLRLERARELLRDPHHLVNQVAKACGYKDESHFISLFKRHHGCTPGQWRRGRAGS